MQTKSNKMKNERTPSMTSHINGALCHLIIVFLPIHDYSCLHGNCTQFHQPWPCPGHQHKSPYLHSPLCLWVSPHPHNHLPHHHCLHHLILPPDQCSPRSNFHCHHCFLSIPLHFYCPQLHVKDLNFCSQFPVYLGK